MNASEAELEVIQLVQMIDATEHTMGLAAFTRYLRACADVRPKLKAQRRALDAKDDAKVVALEEEIVRRWIEESKQLHDLMSEECPF